MHFEVDYTKKYEEAVKKFKEWKQEPLTEKEREELSKLLEKCQKHESHITRMENSDKREEIIRFYGLLAKMAKCQGGHVILDINDERRTATLTYCGRELVQTPSKKDFMRHIISALFNTYDGIVLLGDENGITIIVCARLYDNN